MSSDSMENKKKHKKKRHGHWAQFIIFLLLFVLIVAMVIRFVAGRRITMTLNGESEVTVEIGSHYIEKGATAVYDHKGFSFLRNQPLAVGISGTVDTSTLGDYEVTYTTSYGGMEQKLVRKVHVADTQAPVITLKTTPDYYTPIGQEYVEEGFEAIDAYDGDVTENVLREEPGDGTIRYTVSDRAGNKAVVTRQIPYDDRTLPEITLEGDTEVVVDYDSTFAEPGYTATDDVDGDITAKVVVTTAPGEKKNHTIYTYSVADEHGNTATATRLVVHMDPDVPTLVLAGDEEITLVGGVWYKEPGFKATDRKDGDLTDSVKVDGEVTYWHVGTYTLTYSVKDSDGNEVKAQRVITVKARELPEPVTPDPKTIYLTFDDGPSDYTQELLDVLAKYDVKATFFVTHNNKLANEMIVKEHEAGHTVAVHTYTHDYSKVYKSEKDYFDDMNRMNDVIEQLTGERAAIIRFPGGSSNQVSRNYSTGVMTRLVADMDEMGILFYDWNVLSGDADKTGAIPTEKVYENVINGVAYNAKRERFSVVLQHDVKHFSVRAVEDIIKWGLENGYTFKPLDLTTPTTGGIHQTVAN